MYQYRWELYLWMRFGVLRKWCNLYRWAVVSVSVISWGAAEEHLFYEHLQSIVTTRFSIEFSVFLLQLWWHFISRWPSINVYAKHTAADKRWCCTCQSKAQFDTTDNLLIRGVILEVLRVYSQNWLNDIQQIVLNSELQSISSIHCGFMWRKISWTVLKCSWVMCSKGMVIVWLHKVRAARPECWQNVSSIKYLISRKTLNVRLTSIMLFLPPLLWFAMSLL